MNLQLLFVSKPFKASALNDKRQSALGSGWSGSRLFELRALVVKLEPFLSLVIFKPAVHYRFFSQSVRIKLASPQAARLGTFFYRKISSFAPL